jgi:hypothetical protein
MVKRIKYGVAFKKKSDSKWKMIGMILNKKPTVSNIKRWGYEWILKKPYEYKILRG